MIVMVTFGDDYNMPMKKRTNPTSISLLSVAEIQQRYHFHPNTIRAWVNVDGLRCYHGPRKKIFIREDDLVDFLIKNYAIYAEKGEDV